MKVAVLVDLAFAMKRYKALIEKPSGKAHSAEKVAKCLWDTSIKHVRPDRKDDHELYRILCYDCPPFEGNSQNPITKKNVNFSKTDQAKWRREVPCSAIAEALSRDTAGHPSPRWLDNSRARDKAPFVWEIGTERPEGE